MSIDKPDVPGQEDWRDSEEVEDNTGEDILDNGDADDTVIEGTEIDDEPERLPDDHVEFPTDPEIDTDQDMTRVEKANDE